MSIVQLKRVVRGEGENGNQNLHKYNKATRAKSAKEMLTAQATQAREKQSAVPLTTAIKITNQLSGAGGALLRRVEWGGGGSSTGSWAAKKNNKK